MWTRASLLRLSETQVHLYVECATDEDAQTRQQGMPVMWIILGGSRLKRKVPEFSEII